MGNPQFLNDIPRKGWEKAFAKACKSGAQSETDPFDSIENNFDKKEWTW